MPCSPATLVRMFLPRRIQHCRVCGSPATYRVPARRQPRARHLQSVRRDPLREPAERGRHGAGVGRPGAACAAETSNRAMVSGHCRRASWNVGESTAEGALRETVEEAGANVELQPLFTMLNVVRVGQVHFYYRARMLDLTLAPGPRDHRSAAVPRRRDSLGPVGLPHRARDPRALFRRPPGRPIRAARRRRVLKRNCGD